MNFDERLENWGACWGRKLASEVREYAGVVVESRYRGRGAYHGEFHPTLGSAPRVAIGVDPVDAHAMELAVCALDVFSHVMLKGHYAKRWPEPKTLRVARCESGIGNPRQFSDGEYSRSLSGARVALVAVVDRPAVIRRGRALRLVSLALMMPEVML